MHRNLPAMEHDVLIAYDKIFSAHPATLGRLRRDALANLYITLSGSYFAAGDVPTASRYLAKSMRHRPGKLVYGLRLPLRRFRRRRQR
jgi:hypothetical protein